MTPLKLIAFDLDGTLVHAFKAVAASINHALSRVGLPEESYLKIKRNVGWGEGALLHTFVGKDRLDEALGYYREHHAQALRDGGVRFLPGVRSTLIYLKRSGYTLTVATNRPKRFTRIILEELGLVKVFDGVFCPEDVKKPKPYPDMLLETMQKFGCPKESVLYVGDMTVDVETGQAAGVRTVAVMTGSSRRKDVELLKPYRMISRMSELQGIVDNYQVY